MELSRRDALAALAAVGGAGASATLLSGGDTGAEAGARAQAQPREEATLGDHERATLLSVARVVYPGSVEGVEPFVGTYLDGRVADPEYVAGATEAVGLLDAAGEEWYGDRTRDLDPATRDRLLREVGADTAEPDADGSPAERVRYYLVNELLYALYSSPTGGKLVGVENPQGHPGGVRSYTRSPR